MIRIKLTNQTFDGVHEPLIKRQLFERVQGILKGKTNSRSIKHDYLYRRRLTCKNCSYSLVGERQKGYIYYRCQITDCPTTCIREEVVEDAVLAQFVRLRFAKDERDWFGPKLTDMKLRNVEEQERVINALSLQLAQNNERLNRLTDGYIDRLIEKDIFEQRKTALLVERKDFEQRLAEWRTGKRNPADELLSFLERADGAYLAYKLGLQEEKRDLLDSLTSNRLVSGKTPEIMLTLPFNEVANRFECTNGVPRRDIPRTWQLLLSKILAFLQRKQETQMRSAA